MVAGAETGMTGVYPDYTNPRISLRIHHHQVHSCIPCRGFLPSGPTCGPLLSCGVRKSRDCLKMVAGADPRMVPLRLQWEPIAAPEGNPLFHTHMSHILSNRVGIYRHSLRISLRIHHL